MLLMELPLFTRGKPLSASELLYSSIDYVPPPLRQQIYKTFYIGFCTIFEAISLVLETPASGIPTPEAVMAAALELKASAVQFYLGKGGKVEYVLDAVIDIAREQSNLGDGTFEDTFDRDEGEEEGGIRHRYRELEACRNDLEFGIVRWNVGLRGTGGPYYEKEEEDGMDLDEDDDSDLDGGIW